MILLKSLLGKPKVLEYKNSGISERAMGTWVCQADCC